MSFSLPLNILSLIYSYDNTFHIIFRQIRYKMFSKEHFSCTIKQKELILKPSCYQITFYTKSSYIQLSLCNSCINSNNFIIKGGYEYLISRRPSCTLSFPEFYKLVLELKNNKKRYYVMYSHDDDEEDISSDEEYTHDFNDEEYNSTDEDNNENNTSDEDNTH